jgi:5-methyltetrahydropteroyltriglutamate--homocysteine methyltransferase
MNQALEGRPDDMTVCFHMCRGNYKSSWIAEGGYEPVAEIAFGEMNVDGFFLEFDSPRAGGFAPLRFINGKKIAVLGLVTTKKAALEPKDEIKRRIDEASRYVPLDRLALSPQCGFASGMVGNQISEDDQRRKLRLVVETAREIWGDVG